METPILRGKKLENQAGQNHPKQKLYRNRMILILRTRIRTPDTVLATVDGEEITLQDLYDEFGRIPL